MILHVFIRKTELNVNDFLLILLAIDLIILACLEQQF